MRPTRLATVLAVVPLAVAGCGAAAQSPPIDHGGPVGSTTPRPAPGRVPLDLTKVVIGWSLAPNGTPVLKTLTGAAASRLARDFDALRADGSGMTMCPMIPSTEADITVTFTADGHTWQATIPACPDIHVTRDGTVLPSRAFGDPFLADVRAYTGYLPHTGPPTAPGGVIPLHTSPTR